MREKRRPVAENALSALIDRGRRDRGLTVRGLARATGLSVSRVAELASGKPLRQRPHPPTLDALAAALRIDRDDVHFAAEAAIRGETVRVYRARVGSGEVEIRATLAPGEADLTAEEIESYVQAYREALERRSDGSDPYKTPQT